MKSIFIASLLIPAAGAAWLAENQAAVRSQREEQTLQTAGDEQNRQLATDQAEITTLKAKIVDAERQMRTWSAPSSSELVLAEFLRTNNLRNAPPELLSRLLATSNSAANSSRNYVLVSKAALAGADIRPFEAYPRTTHLSASIIDTLAITPEEQQAVQSDFSSAYDALQEWAKANLQRQGAESNLVVQYTLPADAVFRQSWMDGLMGKVEGDIGQERADILRKNFEVYAYYEDGAVADKTNILAIYRLTDAPGYGVRAGWQWANMSAVNTYPEPIKENRFPSAFRLIFTGGWNDVSQAEGLDLLPASNP